jgi:hypothetical protein
MWRARCYAEGMTIQTLIERVGRDYVEMPDLELTLAQAERLWNLSSDECRAVMDTLTQAGFLKWTARRTIIRTGNALPHRQSLAS